ncbi:MAG: ATP-binding cassette domain-containing protein [Myxococcaceae bacterium]
MLDARLELRRGAFHLSVELAAGPGPLLVTGPNGAGKTTLLLAVLGAIRPTAGRLVLGRDVLFDAASGFSLPTEERRVAYVPQDSGLFPHLSVRDNVGFSLFRLAPPARVARVEEALQKLQAAPLAERLPGALSAGERQRVALARAVAMEPRALLLDEPLAALDAPSRVRFRDFLAEHLRRLDIPALVVTHEADDARALGGDMLVLEAGRVTQHGPVDALRAAPASAFARAFWAQS